MPKNSILLGLSLSIGLLAAGCASGDGNADTSPAKPTTPESRIAAIEKSDMTPQQKEDAIRYVKQGQAQSELMKKSYGQANQSPR